LKKFNNELVSDVTPIEYAARVRGDLVAVIDTETATLWGEVFDFGLVIINPVSGKIHATYDAIAREVFDQTSIMEKAFYFNKVDSFYNPNVRCNRMNVKSWAEICGEVRELCNKHRVSVVAAYNLGFDKKVIKETNRKYDGFSMFGKEVKELCLWKFSCETLLQEENYTKLAVTMGWVSKAGNLLSNAQVAFRYATDQHTFLESHTALDDALIEAELLVQIYKKYKDLVSFGNFGQPWRLINSCKETVKARKEAQQAIKEA
jgi:hypothetical protein